MGCTIVSEPTIETMAMAAQWQVAAEARQRQRQPRKKRSFAKMATAAKIVFGSLPARQVPQVIEHVPLKNEEYWPDEGLRPDIMARAMQNLIVFGN